MRKFVVLLLSCLTVSATAQQYLPQSGNLFDANPQLGSGGNNTYTRPVSPLLGGNAAASGNLRFGGSFRGPSSISDPTDFRSRLGSASLSDFRRDSFGAFDQSRFSTGGLGSGFNQTYYDRSLTAPTAGFLRGLTPNQNRTPGVESRRVRPFVGVNPGRFDSRLNSTYQLPSSANVSNDLSQPVGAPSVASAIFRFHRPQERGLDISRPRTAFDDPTSEVLRTPSWVTQPGPERPSVSQLLGNSGVNNDRISALLSTNSANDLLHSTRLDTRIDDSSLRPRLINGVQPLEEPVPRFSSTRTSLANLSDRPVTVDPSALPGHNLFGDMQIALELSKDPGAEWYSQMRDSALASSAIEGRQLELATQEAEEFVTRVLSEPLSTFVGEGRNQVNNELLKAESLMEIGHFYEAAQRYSAATAIEPLNPLPLLGQANALLAAGEYNSAAQALIRAIQNFPDIARFRFDLTALLGSGEVVDIRRADLMSRLEGFEDPRLRMLLGYLEYHGGLPVRGLENLRRAAEEAGKDSLIQKFVDMVSEQPLPTTSPTAPSAPVQREPVQREPVQREPEPTPSSRSTPSPRSTSGSPQLIVPPDPGN